MKQSVWFASCLVIACATWSVYGDEAPVSSSAPYALSPVIKSVQFAPISEIVCKGHGDNWPLTWADDGEIYTAYCDGHGFGPRSGKELSVGYSKIIGFPPDFVGVNTPSPSGEHYGSGPKGAKASGMLMADGVLYVWLRNVKNSRLAWSSDRAKSWQYGFTFTTSFGCPTFLNAGKDYNERPDDYVYVYSQDGPNAYDIFDGVVLARVPKTRIRYREAYEFFSGLDRKTRPVWSSDMGSRAHVFAFPGHCQRLDVVYNPGIGRFIMAIGYNHKGGWGMYDAPTPWGPWTTVFHTERWDCGDTFTYRLPAKWIRSKGREMHLVFSALGGDQRFYSFSVRKITLEFRR